MNKLVPEDFGITTRVAYNSPEKPVCLRGAGMDGLGLACYMLHDTIVGVVVTDIDGYVVARAGLLPASEL